MLFAAIAAENLGMSRDKKKKRGIWSYAPAFFIAVFALFWILGSDDSKNSSKQAPKKEPLFKAMLWKWVEPKFEEMLNIADQFRQSAIEIIRLSEEECKDSGLLSEKECKDFTLEKLRSEAKKRKISISDQALEGFFKMAAELCGPGVRGAAHDSGGGFVADTAGAARTAFVARAAAVCGNARVSGNARVLNSARVLDNARVEENARISGKAVIAEQAKVSGKAGISDNARISGSARVSDSAKIHGNARIFNSAMISGYAEVFGKAKVSGKARVSGYTQVSGDARVSKAHLKSGRITSGEH